MNISYILVLVVGVVIGFCYARLFFEQQRQQFAQLQSEYAQSSMWGRSWAALLRYSMLLCVFGVIAYTGFGSLWLASAGFFLGFWVCITRLLKRGIQ